MDNGPNQNTERVMKYAESYYIPLQRVMENIKKLGDTDIERAKKMNLSLPDYRIMMSCLIKRRKVLERLVKEVKGD